MNPNFVDGLLELPRKERPKVEPKAANDNSKLPPPSDAKSYQSAGSSNAPLPGSVVFEARDVERYARTVARCKPLVMNPNFADGL